MAGHVEGRDQMSIRDRARQATAKIALGCVGVLWTLTLWVLTCCAQSISAATSASAQTVRIGVLSLFHPKELILRAEDGSSLAVLAGRESRSLTGEAEALVVRAVGDEVQVEFSRDPDAMRERALSAHSDSNRFWLQVPGKLRRRYSGTLEIRANGGILQAIVTMPLEVAVASVVQAESPASAGMEALKAQAVAARSFLAAQQTAHTDFDFCDTTHCQFLRSPPAAGSPTAAATLATKGLVLSWHDEENAADHTLAAMYARSCGGRTRTLGEIGVRSSGYPYYAVHCTYCSHHPEIWRRQSETIARPESGSGSGSVSGVRSDSTGALLTERERLAFNRIHGWGAMPSITENGSGAGGAFAAGEDGLFTGRGIGHGIGMCQLGAADMARRGSSFAQILAHYYPNTKLTAIPAP